MTQYNTVPMVVTTKPIRWQQKSIWQGLLPSQPAGDSLLTVMTNPTTTNPYHCCGSCWIAWDDVHVRYWPQEGQDTSCLSEISPEGSRLNFAIANNMALDTRVPENSQWINIRDLPPSTMTKPTHTFHPLPLITQAPLVRRQNGTGNGTLPTGPVIAIGEDGFT
jgi:hypothetical protein